MRDHAPRRFAAFLIAALAVPSCLRAASPTDALPLVPWPRSVEVPGGVFVFGLGGRIVPQDPSLRPQAEVLAAEIEAVTGLRLPIGDAPTRGSTSSRWRSSRRRGGSAVAQHDGASRASSPSEVSSKSPFRFDPTAAEW
jgi:hypothetical protein